MKYDWEKIKKITIILINPKTKIGTMISFEPSDNKEQSRERTEELLTYLMPEILNLEKPTEKYYEFSE